MNKQLSSEGLEEDIKYFLHKRDMALKQFNKAFEDGKSLEKIIDYYDILIKKHKQYLLIDDALVIHRLSNDKKNK